MLERCIWPSGQDKWLVKLVEDEGGRIHPSPTPQTCRFQFAFTTLTTFRRLDSFLSSLPLGFSASQPRDINYRPHAAFHRPITTIPTIQHSTLSSTQSSLLHFFFHPTRAPAPLLFSVPPTHVYFRAILFLRLGPTKSVFPSLC